VCRNFQQFRVKLRLKSLSRDAALNKTHPFNKFPNITRLTPKPTFCCTHYVHNPIFVGTTGYQPNTTRYQTRKRKHNFEGSRGSERTHVEPADATEAELGGRSLKCSGPVERRPVPGECGRCNQQPEILEAGQDDQLSIATTPPAPSQTVARSRRPSPEPPGKLHLVSAALRTKLDRIADTVTLATLWDYLKHQQTPLYSADDCANALE
jgi:hypothetical protein